MTGKKVIELLSNYIGKHTAFNVNYVLFRGCPKLDKVDNISAVFDVGAVSFMIFVDSNYDVKISDEAYGRRLTITEVE